ncbi:hypothetical protein AA103193_1056 [Tanticharoenia sakaeratensis NBRC 103193]|nr:hypothetical protein AA103193_1056 [Tanticharoenia sakaeratensis NBRC 103193]
MGHRMMRAILLAALTAAPMLAAPLVATAQDIPPAPQGGFYGGQYGEQGSSTAVDGVQGSGAMPQQPAPSQSAPAMTPQMRRDITMGMTYRLPGDFLPRAAATLNALHSSGLQPPNSTGMSLEQTIAQIEAIPGLVPILRANGFDARSFVLGMTAFGMTLATDQGRAPPPGMPAPNPANLALFHAHPDQVQALIQAIGAPPGQMQATPGGQE